MCGTCVFISLEYIYTPRSGIAGLYDNSWSFENCQIDSKSCCTIWLSIKQCISSFSTSSPILVHLCSIPVDVKWVKWYLTVVLICLSLIANDGGYLHIFFREMSVWLLALFFFFLGCTLSMWKSPWPGTEPAPKQRPEPLQWQCQILNSLHHRGTPWRALSPLNS